MSKTSACRRSCGKLAEIMRKKFSPAVNHITAFLEILSRQRRPAFRTSEASLQNRPSVRRIHVRIHARRPGSPLVMLSGRIIQIQLENFSLRNLLRKSCGKKSSAPSNFYSFSGSNFQTRTSSLHLFQKLCTLF